MRCTDSWGYDRNEGEIFPSNGFWPTLPNYEDEPSEDEEYQPYDKYR